MNARSNPSRKAEGFVLTRNPPSIELVHFFYLVDKYKLNRLLKENIEKVKHRTQEWEHGVKMLPEFGLISAEVKYRVISARMTLLEVPLRDILPLNDSNTTVSKLECPCTLFTRSVG